MRLVSLCTSIRQLISLLNLVRDRTIVEDVVVESEQPKSIYRVPSLDLMDALSIPDDLMSPREELARTLLGSPPNPKHEQPKLVRQSSKFSCINMVSGTTEFKKLCKIFRRSIIPPQDDDPLTFKLGGVIKVENEILEKQHLKTRRTLKEGYYPEFAFHGTSSQQSIFGICEFGLLPIGHADNPSDPVDHGKIGNPRYGVNLTRSINCAVKHSNFMKDLQLGEKAQIVIFKVVTGKSKKLSSKKAKATSVNKRLVHQKRGKFGYDSYTLREEGQIYLTNPEFCHPVYILEIRAVARKDLK